MKPISKQKLLSISNSLKSNTRKFGPRLTNKHVKEVVGGDKKINSDFSKNIIEVVYNSTPAEYYEYSIKDGTMNTLLMQLLTTMFLI